MVVDPIVVKTVSKRRVSAEKLSFAEASVISESFLQELITKAQVIRAVSENNIDNFCATFMIIFSKCKNS